MNTILLLILWTINEAVYAFTPCSSSRPHLVSLTPNNYFPCVLHSTIESTSEASNDSTSDTNNYEDVNMNDGDIGRFMETTVNENDNVATTRRTIPTIQQPRPIIQRTRYQALVALIAIVTAADNGLQFQSMPVAETLLSLVVSVVIVSGMTDAVERITSQDVPPYSLNGERYDQSSFRGRFCKMLLGCDPRLLLYTQEEIQKCKSLAYDDWKVILQNNDNSHETNRLLWEARRKADSALHTETHEWIPRPFRMSGYLPFNGPICIAMIASTSTLPLLLWSFFNQSQNALINYYNGPKPIEESDDKVVDDKTTIALDGKLMKSYIVAVVSALSVAFGLSNYVQGHYSGEEATQLLRFISFPSAVIASSLNCYIVRQPEIEMGVPLLNEDMEVVLPGETSSIAAKKGVLFTTATRAVLQMPTYFIPPLLLETITPLKIYMAENPSMVVPITTFLLLISFGIGLPATVGLFPQMARIRVEEVEQKYQNLGYDELYYNKGL